MKLERDYKGDLGMNGITYEYYKRLKGRNIILLFYRYRLLSNVQIIER